MAGTIGATLSYALTSPQYRCNESLLLSGEHNHNHNHHHGPSMAIPFTIGGFLYISLVGIVPEIVEEEDRKLSLIQLCSFLAGVLFIYFLVEIENNMEQYY